MWYVERAVVPSVCLDTIYTVNTATSPPLLLSQEITGQPATWVYFIHRPGADLPQNSMVKWTTVANFKWVSFPCNLPNSQLTSDVCLRSEYSVMSCLEFPDKSCVLSSYQVRVSSYRPGGGGGEQAGNDLQFSSVLINATHQYWRRRQTTRTAG